VNRLDLTQRLLQELDQEQDLDCAVAAWWWDTRPQGGLRLTDQGREVMANLVKQHWQFDIPESVLTARNLLTLDRFMTCAYHIQRRRRQYVLTLFGDRESMMANLYGDVERFIASLEP
jgi:hypothetical protein